MAVRPGLEVQGGRWRWSCWQRRGTWDTPGPWGAVGRVRAAIHALSATPELGTHPEGWLDWAGEAAAEGTSPRAALAAAVA